MMCGMREILPGVWHWTTVHERHGIEISSYLLGTEGVVIDPRVPDGGLDAVAEVAEPAVAVLTNRHHYRHAGRFAEAFGTRILVNRLGAQEFTDGERVEFFDAGDGLVRWQPESPLAFVPDMLMYDPERTKQGLVDAYRRVLELDWDTLLLAHGRPLVGEEGRREMTRVVEAHGGSGP